MNKSLNYENVCIVPKKSIVNSRDDCDTSIHFAGKKWKIPVLPSNMASTIDFNLAEWFGKNGYFYILHRFYDYKTIFEWVKTNQDMYVSISVGVKDIDKELLHSFVKNKIRIDCLTVDIAHGFSISMEKMVLYINGLYKNSDVFRPFVIAGNVFGDYDSIKFLENIYVDAIKVGLAFGKACTTYNQTGFASPMFSCGMEASKIAKVPLIGDGGVRENGDVIKGLSAGYDMIMCGSLFASCKDSPSGMTVDGNKLYYGSASEINKKSIGMPNRYVEGRLVELKCNNMTYEEKLKELQHSIKSGISYAGGDSLKAFNLVDYIIV
jgi:GMP reductase